MAWWDILCAIEIPHNFVGIVFAFCFKCDGFEFVNPNWIYRNYRVNKFGAIFLSVLFGLICPIGTIIYWIYKLCTIGRKKEDDLR